MGQNTNDAQYTIFGKVVNALNAKEGIAFVHGYDIANQQHFFADENDSEINYHQQPKKTQEEYSKKKKNQKVKPEPAKTQETGGMVVIDDFIKMLNAGVAHNISIEKA